ncbi:MAG: hypothetical protein PUP93_09245 [Rhizonema sp. NSF051]|nr:hypothetical protein [Rhizonema sp. NSF051]
MCLPIYDVQKINRRERRYGLSRCQGHRTRLPKRFPKTPKLTVVHLKSIWQFGNYFTQHRSIV